jgi:hypothetical protein
MKLIASAIINVMKEVRGMEKNSQVGSGRMAYNGTKDQDVKEVFNKALAENGLCVLPIGIDEETQIDRWEEDDTYNKKPPYPKKSKQSVFTKVKTKYLLLHDSGESIEIAGYGHGVDPQDKGAGKATTYALKNALLYAFLTPVGKIDDSDTTHSNDVSTPRDNNNNNNQPTKPPELLTNAQMKKINTLITTLGIDREKVKQSKGVKSMKELWKTTATDLIKQLENYPKTKEG